MRLLKQLLTTLFLLVMMPYLAYADDGNTFYCFTRSSSTPYTISLDDLKKMTFSGSGIQLWSNKGMNEISFGDFLLIAFSEIEHPFVTPVELASMPQGIQIRYSKDSRTLFVESDSQLDGVSVYDLLGRMVSGDASASSHYNFSLTAVPKGAYVVKTKQHGRVIVKKIVL